MTKLPGRGLLLAATLSTTGCYLGEVPAGCDDDIQVLQELLIVEDQTLAELEQSETSKARFGHALSRLMPTNADHARAANEWLAAWTSSIEQHPAAVNAVETVLTCPWLRASAANECAPDCSTCRQRDLDLTQAPLRLTAVVYRPDLKGHPDLAGAAGEARLVYAPSNDADSERLSLIVEFPLPNTTEHDWARRWHELQGLNEELRDRRLLSLISDFARFEAKGRVRTLLQADVDTVPMHEFSWNEDKGRLLPVPLRRVPKEDLDLQALSQFVNTHADEVRLGHHSLPRRWRAPFANAAEAPLTLPGVDAELNEAFQRETCNGCHGHTAKTRDHLFHIAPSRKDSAKLSPFLHSLDAHDELETRESALRAQLCE